MRFQESKNRTKIDKKSIKKLSQDRESSWHRFFMDVRCFWEASWSQVGTKNQQKKTKKAIKDNGKKASGDVLGASWNRLSRFGGGRRTGVTSNAMSPP